MICAFIGCDRDAGDRWHCKTHSKQLQRRKNPDLLTPIGVPVEDVKPCRRCGGREFGLQTLRRPPSGKRYLGRYCATCRAAHRVQWAKSNPEKVIAASRRYQRSPKGKHQRWVREQRARRTSATDMLLIDDIHFDMLSRRSVTSPGSRQSLADLNQEANSTPSRPRRVALGF